MVIARQFGSALEPFILDLSGGFHGLFFALRFVSFCRPSSKRPRSRAARGSSLQRAPRTPPAKSGLMRATGEAPGGATDLKWGGSFERIAEARRQTVSKSDGWTCPKSGRAEAREHGSRGQGRRSRWSAHEKRVCGDRIGAKRIGGRCSLAMRHFAHGACAVVGGVAGNSPLEWGAGDDGRRRGSRAGKVVSPKIRSRSIFQLGIVGRAKH